MRVVFRIDIGADDPVAMRASWLEVGIDHAVPFVPAGSRCVGIDAIDLVAANRARTGGRRRSAA